MSGWWLLALLATTFCTVAMGEQCQAFADLRCPKIKYPEDTYKPSARCVQARPGTVICCNVTKFTLKEGVNTYPTNISQIIVRQYLSPELNVQDLFHQPKQVRSVSITDSPNLKHLIGHFTPSVVCLNLSFNSLTDIDAAAFQHLGNLKFLDVSNNNLTQLPDPNVTSKKLNIDISGNHHMFCHLVQDMMTEHELVFHNRKNTFCSSILTFNWFNSTEQLNIEQLEGLKGKRLNCPRPRQNSKCKCKPTRLQIVEESVSLQVMVDCSGQHLQNLPEILPTNTVFLNVSNNNISSLAPLAESIYYKQIRVLIADNNKVRTILDLEGSDFIKKMGMLSLRNNSLQGLETYILSNTFDRNINSQVFLAYNKLHCDCSTAQSVKFWLNSNEKYIIDANLVECENYKEKVVDLDPDMVCDHQRVWTDYISYIIAGEVMLLLFLISKVSYDYWVFKTAGYLPWPASKMPKMPCDWVFET